MPSLAIDLGGTSIRHGFADDENGVTDVRRSRIANFLNDGRPDVIWQSLLGEITGFEQEMRPRLEPSDPIVVAFPGPIINHRTIVAAPTVIGNDAEIPDIAGALEQRTGRPVHLINDLSAAALYLSREIEEDRFMVVTVSSGIGSKVFDRRHALGVLDDVPWGGEIGHLVVDDALDAPECDCGGRGHLGAISSGRGTERLARRMAAGDPDRFAESACSRRLGAGPSTLTNELHLVPAFVSGDPWARDVVRRAAEPLARVISTSAFALGIKRVALIGGFALGLGPEYVAMLRALVAPSTAGSAIVLPSGDFIFAAQMHADACLLGAAEFARRMRAGRN